MDFFSFGFSDMWAFLLLPFIFVLLEWGKVQLIFKSESLIYIAYNDLNQILKMKGS